MKEKVIDQLKRAYDYGRVNAMNIFKGSHYATGASGWHWQDFGRNIEILVTEQDKVALFALALRSCSIA